MACTVTTGRGIDCRDAVGGVAAIYILVDASDNPVTLTNSNSTVVAAEITDVDGASGEVFESSQSHLIDLVRNSGSLTTNVVGSMENGTFYYTTTLEFTLHKLDHQTQDLIDKLARHRSTIAVLDNNNNLWAAGFETGIEMTGSDGGTGATFADRHGVTLTFQTEHTVPMPMFARTDGAGTTNYPFDGLTTASMFAVSTDTFKPVFE